MRTARNPGRSLLQRKAGCCSWCGEPVVKPRLTWCSDECVREYKFLTDPAQQREAVEQRDQGVCCLCGLDTLAWEKARDAEIRRLQHEVIERVPTGLYLAGDPIYWAAVHLVENRMAALRLPRARWEADHILPIVEGGGVTREMTREQLLANLRTLCLPCHRGETAALAARRADARRDAKKIAPLSFPA